MRPQFITIQTFRHFFEWLKSRLDGKANAEHEHTEYLSELPVPLTKIGETNGQMTYDGQVVTGGGGGEPAWGEYGQFKKVIVDIPGVTNTVTPFWDFVRDHYAYQPGMYVFLSDPSPTAIMVYSEDGVMVTKMYNEGIWSDFDGEEGMPPPFAITDIPNMFADTLEEMSFLVYDNLEMEGEPIASFGRTDLPAFGRRHEIAYATIYNRYNKQGHLHDTFVELKLHHMEQSHVLEPDGRWRYTKLSGGEYSYYGNPYPEP